MLKNNYINLWRREKWGDFKGGKNGIWSYIYKDMLMVWGVIKMAGKLTVLSIVFMNKFKIIGLSSKYNYFDPRSKDNGWRKY